MLNSAFRPIQSKALLVLVTALLVMSGGCGNDTTTSMAASGACGSANVASYIGTTCSQGQTVFHWMSYSCDSTPTSICDSLGTNGSNIRMRLDPNGPHTLLVGGTKLWNVTAGQSVHVTIQGTVTGAQSNQNWPHFAGTRGQTSDGVEENKTTVGCASTGTCIAGGGVSDIVCSATSPAAFCTDQPTITPYISHRATFALPPSDSPDPLTIEIKLDGGSSGTASLHSVGVHVSGK